MSGGSFDYLYVKAGDWYYLSEFYSQMTALAEWLEYENYSKSAEKVKAWTLAVDQLLAQAKEMEDLLHTAEWVASYDWSNARMREIEDKLP